MLFPMDRHGQLVQGPTPNLGAAWRHRVAVARQHRAVGGHSRPASTRRPVGDSEGSSLIIPGCGLAASDHDDLQTWDKPGFWV